MEGKEHMIRNEIAVLRRISIGHANILTLVDYFETLNNCKSIGQDNLLLFVGVVVCCALESVFCLSLSHENRTSSPLFFGSLLVPRHNIIVLFFYFLLTAFFALN